MYYILSTFFETVVKLNSFVALKKLSYWQQKYCLVNLLVKLLIGNTFVGISTDSGIKLVNQSWLEKALIKCLICNTFVGLSSDSRIKAVNKI